ncbi:hypothetical protein [Solwaraspora sp. WMMD792]|uniref:hypothetical protein n=1 Tax=Solwaraspora sp. WMMD792 TaxID=3016099 RepID=UPI0024178D2A|nr:hypothetical protein [Solwaraspora sp. WMMD792]MDG4768749.1 hypothetical protein [Solwaraspora sp. WMMD792]MDG4768788.1 hypothetical protein [Solwaraspora sp. WMMD792]MDG4768828.1 hypothetical protein [Solwaraspora sp. WMMD792]MDG4768856.1 hypothetical protein [Solwaraspora sp. WMMD792]MDG4768889.1 hypothetical protein [Solwaraspora sp. WMMD792]
MKVFASHFWAGSGWWTAPIHPLWLAAALLLFAGALRAAVVVRRRRTRRLNEHWASVTAALAVRPRHHDLSTWAVVAITVAVSVPVSAVIGAVVALIAVTVAGAGRGDPWARAARVAGLTRDVRDALDLARPSTTAHDQTEQRGQQQ